MADGLRFLEDGIGHSYDWANIFNQASRVLRSPIFLDEPGKYDCSDLVTRFVLPAGGEIANALGNKAWTLHLFMLVL